MATLSPVYLGTVILAGFLVMLALRQLLVGRILAGVQPLAQPRRVFILDFTICVGAALLIMAYQSTVLDFPVASGGSVLIGCIMAGFFIGLDSALIRERQVILEATEKERYGGRPLKYSPITRKFTAIAVITFVFVCLVLGLVFARDIEWLVTTAQDPNSIANAQLAVLYEIFFIMAVLLILTVNLVISYSKNLKLLFDNETGILERVRDGDLSRKVPVATRDEFGVIAAHTNHMIDGLRHRFELMHSLKLAEEVQQNLLPTKSPFLQRYEINGASLYCDQTGGDYYDYFLLAEDKLGIAVADACGHGVGAAMLITTVRAFLISAVEGYTDPASLLTRINRLISRDCAASGNFTAMLFAEIDPHEDRITWVRAGHEPPLLFRKNTATVERLDGGGIVLGIDETYTFENESLDDARAGDIILIGTDGIYETRNEENEIFGYARVEAIVVRHQDGSAVEIQQALLKAVREFRGRRNQEDDITLVVIKVR